MHRFRKNFHKNTPSRRKLSDGPRRAPPRAKRVADIAGVIITETLRGSDTTFDDRIHALQRHTGQRACAANLRKLIAVSETGE